MTQSEAAMAPTYWGLRSATINFTVGMAMMQILAGTDLTRFTAEWGMTIYLVGMTVICLSQAAAPIRS